jgi:hypothetical protein
VRPTADTRWQGGGTAATTLAPMKAVTFADYGPPEVLRVADAEEPHPGEGQIRIAVRAG